MVDVNRSAPLFDKSLPLQLQNAGEVSPLLLTDSQRQTTLVFRVLQGSQPTAVIGQNETFFHFEVTDDRDPYFLFFFDVGENSFAQFKREQSILVDFHVFPHMLIELLDFCLRTQQQQQQQQQQLGGGLAVAEIETTAEDGESVSSLRLLPTGGLHTLPQSTYTAKLDISSGHLSIIESNKFKQLTHISLPLRRGDDAAIKLYLASRLALTLEVSRRQHRDLEALSDRLHADELTHAALSVEVNQLRCVPHSLSVSLSL
jgi:hypothetical protein